MFLPDNPASTASDGPGAEKPCLFGLPAVEVDDGAVDGDQLGESFEEVSMDREVGRILFDELSAEVLEECGEAYRKPALKGG